MINVECHVHGHKAEHEWCVDERVQNEDLDLVLLVLTAPLHDNWGAAAGVAAIFLYVYNFDLSWCDGKKEKVN